MSFVILGEDDGSNAKLHIFISEWLVLCFSSLESAVRPPLATNLFIFLFFFMCQYVEGKRHRPYSHTLKAHSVSCAKSYLMEM